MNPRFQRLLMILISLTLIAGSLFLILNNSKKNITFFYTPSELIETNVSINQKIRIGGFINKESIINGSYSTTDMYYKGSWMLHTLRTVLQNDILWKKILKGLQKKFKQRIVYEKRKLVELF